MSDAKSNIALDLDSLAPKKVQISYKGQLIQVNPLTLEQFAKLYELSSDMAGLADVVDNNKLIDVYKKIDALIREAIPELKDERLNQNQLTALIELLSSLNTPQDKALTELNKRGVSLTKGGNSDPKVLI